MAFSSDWTVEDYKEIIVKVLEQKDIIRNKVPDLRIPLNFQKTTEPYDPKQPQNCNLLLFQLSSPSSHHKR